MKRVLTNAEQYQHLSVWVGQLTLRRVDKRDPGGGILVLRADLCNGD